MRKLTSEGARKVGFVKKTILAAKEKADGMPRDRALGERH